MSLTGISFLARQDLHHNKRAGAEAAFETLTCVIANNLRLEVIQFFERSGIIGGQLISEHSLYIADIMSGAAVIGVIRKTALR